MDDGAGRLLAGWNARETSGVKKPMRTLKWMTIFASLALFSQAVQAQGQSSRVDITGDAAVEIADFFEEDRSELYYFIVDKQSRARTQLFFPGLPDVAFKSGVKLRIPEAAAPAPEAADLLRDPGNTLGHKNGSIQGQDARDLEEPPPFAGDDLSILFTSPLFEASSWGFTTDFRAPADSPAGEWPFVVKASSSSEPITLSWKAAAYDLAGAWLVDQQTGERIAVTAGGSYTFQPLGKESSFVFIIE
jgi:hypothetical protein